MSTFQTSGKRSRWRATIETNVTTNIPSGCITRSINDFLSIFRHILFTSKQIKPATYFEIRRFNKRTERMIPSEMRYSLTVLSKYSWLRNLFMSASNFDLKLKQSCHHKSAITGACKFQAGLSLMHTGGKM